MIAVRSLMTTHVGKEWASVIYRANCADCGEVVIRAAESSLHVTGPQSSWRCTFSCPVCRRDALWPISAGAGHLLVAGGAQVTVQVAVQLVPVTHRLPPPPAAGRELQLDDLIDFHELLAGDGWFDQLIESRQSPRGHAC